jgi:putative transferase (TIGR04331 family)
MKRFLVTTALKSTIKIDEPILYLGEWCMPSCKSIDKVADYYISDRKDLYKEYIFLNKFTEKLLDDMSRNLNKIHCINKPVDYWRILLGPWLYIFIQIIYERWNQIKFVESNYSLTGVYVYSGSETIFVPKDHTHFNELLSSDEWNFYIYSKIIEFSTNMDIIGLNINFVNKQRKISNRLKIKSIILETLQLFNRKKSIVLLDFSLSLGRYLILFFIHGYANRLAVYSTENNAFNFKKRNFQFPKPNSEFEKLIYKLIPKQIPKAYIEDYEALSKSVRSSNLPAKPDKIVTSYIHFNEYIKLYIAEKSIKGAELIISQHGGGYGSYKWFFNQYHELKISDKFMSWGWNDSNKKIIPLGMMKRNDFKYRKQHTQNNFSLILNSLPRYSYKNASEPQTKFFNSYINDQIEFINALDDVLRNKLIVKTYNKDYGWGIENRLKSSFPKLNISSNIRLKDISKKSRIIVSTFNSTTLLETISSDIPTIFFWNPSLHELSNFSEAHYEILFQVKVFHKNPISAANHIRNIWKDVDLWWCSNEVRNAILEFSTIYCSPSTFKKNIFKDVNKIHNLLSDKN